MLLLEPGTQFLLLNPLKMSRNRKIETERRLAPLGFLAQFHVPIGHIEEMLPTVVMVHAEVDLHERPPLGTPGLADEAHPGLGGSLVGLACIAGDARADNVLPGRRPAAVARDHVIEIQILPLETPAAVLAGVPVSLENIMPGELDLFLRQSVEQQEQDDPRYAHPKRDGVDAVRVGLLLGEIAPLPEVKRLEGTVVAALDDLRAAFDQERDGPSRRADVYRLPQAIEHQHMLAETRVHTCQ